MEGEPPGEPLNYVDPSGGHWYALHMELIARIGEKEIWQETLQRPYALQPPFPGQEFICILFINDSSLTAEEQNLLSEQIIAAGCRNAVCAGIDCESFHDAIDWTVLEANNYECTDDTFVMTTWHEDEPISEVIWYGLNSADIHQRFVYYLILMIGPSPEVEEEIRQSVQAEGEE
ncbi:MAG: DUF7684 family protein [Armatimonadota bacterium]